MLVVAGRKPCRAERLALPRGLALIAARPSQPSVLDQLPAWTGSSRLGLGAPGRGAMRQVVAAPGGGLAAQKRGHKGLQAWQIKIEIFFLIAPAVIDLQIEVVTADEMIIETASFGQIMPAAKYVTRSHVFDHCGARGAEHHVGKAGSMEIGRAHV